MSTSTRYPATPYPPPPGEAKTNRAPDDALRAAAVRRAREILAPRVAENVDALIASLTPEQREKYGALARETAARGAMSEDERRVAHMIGMAPEKFVEARDNAKAKREKAAQVDDSNMAKIARETGVDRRLIELRMPAKGGGR